MMPQEVRTLLARLESAGHQAWAVGGCVRDTLRRAAPSDWDVTTDARPEQIMSLFGQTAIPTGLKHGTVTVRTGETRVEVTTFRRDGTYSDHRRPDAVRFSTSLEEDLARRDLTVNAMAMDLRGHICDPFGGQDDLSRQVLRCVGEPMRRLDEDALRIMRTLRFAAVLGFAIEPETAAALHRCAPLLADIAAERILVEMDKLLAGQDMASVLLAFPDVIGVFLPEIRPCVGFDQRNKHHCYDVWEHSVRAAEAIAPDAVLRWAMLLHDIGKPDCFTEDEQGVGHFYGHPARSAELAEKICRRLRMDKKSAQRIVTLVRWHDRDIPRTEKAVARAARQLGEETLRQLLAVKRADNRAQSPLCRGRAAELDKAEAILDELVARQSCFSLRDLAVRGSDLTALGLHGPAVGQTLQRLLDAVMDGEAPNEKESLLRLVTSDLRHEP